MAWSLPRPFEWVTGQSIGSRAGFEGARQLVLAERVAEHDEVLRTPGHHARHGAEGVERAQSPADQLVAGDRGSLQVRERAQRLGAPRAAQSREQLVDVARAGVLAHRYRQREQHRLERRGVLALMLGEAPRQRALLA